MVCAATFDYVSSAMIGICRRRKIDFGADETRSARAVVSISVKRSFAEWRGNANPHAGEVTKTRDADHGPLFGLGARWGLRDRNR